MQLHPIYLEVKPGDIAYVKFIFESYEGVGIVRTMDRKQAVIVVLVVDDFVNIARQILESLSRDMTLKEITKPADISDDWFMSELYAESERRED